MSPFLFCRLCAEVPFRKKLRIEHLLALGMHVKALELMQ